MAGIDEIGRLKRLLAVANAGPMPYLLDTWQDFVGGIDPNVWQVAGGVGAPWANTITAEQIHIETTLNLNDTARIYGIAPWPVMPDLGGANKIMRRIHLEFVMQLANVANMDNTLCMFGWAPATNADRSSDNLITFSLLADVLETLTDLAAAETSTTTFGETLTNWNKFRITTANGAAYFYLNEAPIAVHITNLPDVPMYPMWYVDTEAGGGATPRLGPVRIWTEDNIE